jgi:Leucine-rich repeat (LRR) protein
MKKYIYIALLLVSSTMTYSQNYLFADTLLQYTTAVHLNLPYNSPVPQSAVDTITMLDCSGLGIADVADLAGFSMLKSVNLSYNKIEDVTILASLPNLRFIDLSNNKLTSIDVLAFPETDTLTINVSQNYIDDFTLFSDNTIALFNIIGLDAQKTSFTETYYNSLTLSPITNNCQKFNIEYGIWSNNPDTTFLHFGDSTKSAIIVNGYTNSILHEYSSTGVFPMKIKIGSDSITKIAKVEIIGQPIINYQNGQLHSTALTGNQWYLNGVKIDSEISNSMTPTQTGTYKVIVTCENGCLSESNPLAISALTTSLDSQLNKQEFTVYPNPAKSFTTISSTESIDRIELCDISGRVIQKLTVNSTTFQLDLNKLTKGVYLLKGFSESGLVIRKLVKE